MLITRINHLGKEVTKELDITPLQLSSWEHSTTLNTKEAFPNLSDEDLLFFDTGMSSEDYQTVVDDKEY